MAVNGACSAGGIMVMKKRVWPGPFDEECPFQRNGVSNEDLEILSSA